MTHINFSSSIHRKTKGFVLVALLPFLILVTLSSCRRQPKAMDIFLADSANRKNAKLPASSASAKRTMILCLGKDNNVLYYLGNLDKPLEGPALTGYGKDSLDKVILSNINKIKDTADCLIVLIKVSDKATYINFVKALDVVNSCKVKSYGVVPITPKETELLKRFNAY